MGYLHHDASTVAGLVACLCAAVLHILKYLQCIIHQFVALATMDVYHHAHAACVVLIFRLVKPSLRAL